MSKIRRDQIALMQELRKVVTKCIDNASVKVELEEEVADLLTEVVDQRQARKLKKLRSELDGFINEMITFRAIQKAENKLNEEKRIKIAEIREERANEHQ
jgi:hypothetical protein